MTGSKLLYAAALAVALLTTACGNSEQEKVREVNVCLNRAHADILAGDYAPARTALQRASILAPDDYRVSLMSAALEERAGGGTQTALAHAQQALKQSPENFLCHYTVGRLMKKNTPTLSMPEIYPYFQKASTLTAPSPELEARNLLAAAATARTMRQWPDVAHCLLKLADVYERAQQPHKAYEAYNGFFVVYASPRANLKSAFQAQFTQARTRAMALRSQLLNAEQ